jgi:hypothetical protein
VDSVQLDETAKPNRSPAALADSITESPRLPTRIPNGFRGLVDDIERRQRELSLMARLMDQMRLEFETADRERQALHGRIAQTVALVQETERGVTGAVEKVLSGDLGSDVSTHMMKHGRALDELEKLAQALNTNLLWWRSSWEQYARSAINAQRLKDELRIERH